MTTSAPPTVVIPATPSSREILVRLFPGVKPPPSLLAPGRVPNCGPEATAALLKALRITTSGAMSFSTSSVSTIHRLLAIHALGASAPVINASYEDTHLDHLRVAFVAPNKVTITDDTFTDYLGNDHYYNAYLDYFHRVVLQPGANISDILEKYIFSSHYNVRTPKQGTEQPEMLNRFLEILIHPIIHVGYGAEFGIMGLIAEGLAWTSVHPAGATTPITRLLFTQRTTPISELEKQEPGWMPKAGLRLRALNILTLMVRDPRFFGNRTLDKHEFAAMLESHGEIFVKYGELWDCQIETQEDLEARMEELIWAAMLMYGVGSWDGNEAEYRADFFTAHIVTSVLFIPTICRYLSRESQTKLLRAHFLTSITWWVVHGRPSFALKDFTSRPLPPVPNAPSSKYSNALPGILPTPAACALSSTTPYAGNANPWYAILADALVHPNEHLCKVHREAGFVLESLSKDGVDVNPEYGYLDGSVFLRTAWLTTAALGWVTHGKENTGAWNYQEFQKAALEELELMKGQGRA
ncbi:hypothetical protein JVU11DRAFT_12309 [Chiua virens]|nr:hypothetical protein JVU11DRAFT_12309 [Chiua virens]